VVGGAAVLGRDGTHTDADRLRRGGGDEEDEADHYNLVAAGGEEADRFILPLTSFPLPPRNTPSMHLRGSASL
jgi:hypothetical protein